MPVAGTGGRWPIRKESALAGSSNAMTRARKDITSPGPGRGFDAPALPSLTRRHFAISVTKRAAFSRRETKQSPTISLFEYLWFSLRFALLPSRRPLSRTVRRIPHRPTDFFGPRVREVRDRPTDLPGRRGSVMGRLHNTHRAQTNNGSIFDQNWVKMRCFECVCGAHRSTYDINPSGCGA